MKEDTKTFIKLIGYILILSAVLSYTTVWYNTFIIGSYYVHASIFMTVLFGISPAILIFGAFKLIKLLKTI